jgi:hypothetical protein
MVVVVVDRRHCHLVVVVVVVDYPLVEHQVEVDSS